MYLNRLEITGNAGTELVKTYYVDFENSLVADNQSSGRLVEGTTVFIGSSTVAGNLIGGPEVVGIQPIGRLSMSESVAFQPPLYFLHNGDNYPLVQDVLASEAISLYGQDNQHVTVGNPRFIDAAHGNYRLTAASPGVDYFDGDTLKKDLLGLPHYVDLGFVPNRYGPTDVGAYERQTLQPLAENGEFAGNANVWKIGDASAASSGLSDRPMPTWSGTMQR